MVESREAAACGPASCPEQLVAITAIGGAVPDLDAIEDLLRHRLSRTPSFTVPKLDSLRVCTANMPPWWTANGNLLLTADPDYKPNILVHPPLPPPTNGVVVAFGRATPPQSIILWGDAPVVLIEAGTGLPACNLACGGGSTIALGRNISIADGASLNARNGGVISVGAGGLWSNRIYFATDDMHAILDMESGERVNPFGGVIAVGEHVWLGLEAMILGGAVIGRDCVIGARSFVRHELPPDSSAAGAPARVTRQGITWSHDDRPPTIKG